DRSAVLKLGERLESLVSLLNGANVRSGVARQVDDRRPLILESGGQLDLPVQDPAYPIRRAAELGWRVVAELKDQTPLAERGHDRRPFMRAVGPEQCDRG